MEEQKRDSLSLLQAENESLKTQLKAERFMMEQFSKLNKSDNLHNGIHSVLQALGEYTMADRAYVFEIDEEYSSSNTYEWCGPDVTPQIDNLKVVPFESMPYWISHFLTGENIFIEDIEEIKNLMPSEYQILKIQDIKCLIAFPIAIHKRLIGFVGVDNPDLSKSRLIIRMLSVLGQYMGYAIDDYQKEQTKIEMAALKSREAYQQNIESILSGAQIGIWTIKMDEGQPPRLFADRTMRNLLGVDKSVSPEDCYSIWFKNIEPDYVPAALEYVESIKAKGQDEIIYPWNHPELGQIWIRCGGLLEVNDKENGICFKGYHQNVTENIEKERSYQHELEKALDEAQRANIAKSDFLRRMSHDVRTPINGIMGMLAIEEKNMNNLQKLQECHEKVRSATSHLLSLVNDILDMSKLESGKITVEQKPFDLFDLIDSCFSLLEPQADNMGLTLNMPKRNELKYSSLIGSPTHIRQIFMNILSNAVKYNKPYGQVSFQADILKEENHSILYQFTISDTGVGMSEEFLKHIFETFSQEKSDARTVYQGTGLGMAIVEKLVHLMNGKISVQSKKDVGTTFTLILPFLVNKETPCESEKKTEFSPDLFSGKSVLLVEDNDLNREIAEYLLSDAGFHVTTAHDGKEGFLKFEHSAPHQFDIVLMDIMMPVMNGLEASRAIRTSTHPDALTIPIIAMTANAFSDDIEKTRQAGMNAHLAKPVEIQKLLETIAQFL